MKAKTIIGLLHVIKLRSCCNKSYPSRLWYCKWSIISPSKTCLVFLISDEIWFTWSCYRTVKSQTNCYWSQENICHEYRNIFSTLT